MVPTRWLNRTTNAIIWWADSQNTREPSVSIGPLARRGAAIVLLVMIVLAARNVGESPFTGDTGKGWWRALISLTSGGHGRSAFRDLVTPNSGEQVLPPLVRDMLALLRQHGVQEYAVSPQISTDPLLHQRIVESAFPKMMVPTAPYLLARVGEPLPANCRPMAVEKGIELAACD
jgi:hypothetical protein